MCFSCEEKSKNIANFIIPGIQNSASEAKIVQNMTTLFLESHSGLTCFLTGQHTSGVPQEIAEWKYSIGMLLKRDNEIGTIILFGQSTGNLAICSVNKVLGSWRII